MKACLEFAKGQLKDSQTMRNKILWSDKDSQTMRNKILWSDETKIEHFGLNAKRHIWRKSCTIPTVKHGGGSITL